MNITIRTVTLADAAAMLEIYRPYVETSHITFETEVPSQMEFKSKIEKTLKNFPWLVAEVQGRVVGYAYANLFRERAAYAWALESSIYLADHAQGRTLGVATALYQHLFHELREREIKQVIGVISLPNVKSVRFHEKLGFKEIGIFPSVGLKLGQWWDVLFMTKFLEELPFQAPSQSKL